MRKVTAGLFHSVDGVVEAPYRWQFDAFDDELGTMLGETLAKTDTVLLGRVGYDDWAAYWPKAKIDEGFAQFINKVPKFVASRSRTGKLEWENSTVIKGDLESFVRDLKGKPGKEIAVMSSVSLVRQLLFAGLLDELTLITHPVIAGQGKHLFEPTDPVTRLRLINCTRTSKGNVVTVYAKA